MKCKSCGHEQNAHGTYSDTGKRVCVFVDNEADCFNTACKCKGFERKKKIMKKELMK